MCVSCAGSGYHFAGTDDFRVVVWYQAGDNDAPHSIGSCSSNLMNVKYQCVECAAECIPKTFGDTSAVTMLKVWAQAIQHGVPSNVCQCTSDTVRMSISGNPAPATFPDTPLVAERGPIPCDACINDPINATNGNVYIERQDVRMATDRGIPIAFGRHYNSFDDTTKQTLGYNWRHSFDYTLAAGSPDGYLLTEATGRQVRFAQLTLISGTDTVISFSPPYGIHYRLSVNQGVYTVAKEDDTKLVFDGLGHLDYLEDRASNRVTLSYTNDTLVRVTDASGRWLSLTYSSSKLSVVKDSSNNTLASYEYYSGTNLLKKVSYPDGQWEMLVYGDSAYNSRKVVNDTTSDGRGNHYAYATSGKATKNFLSDDFNRVNLSWQARSDSCPFPTTITSNAPGRSGLHIADWAPDYSRRLVVKRQNTDCPSCGTEYDYNGGGMKSTITYANGQQDKYEYDDRGNLKLVVVAATSADSQSTTYLYHPTFNLPVRTRVWSIAKTGDSSIKRFHINAQGNITKVIDSSWLNATTRLIVADSIKYDSKGQVIWFDGSKPNLDELTDITTFEYDSAGGTWDIRKVILANADSVVFGNRNLLGYRTWVTGPNGDTTKFVFDSRGRMTKVTYLSGTADSASASFAYDFDGNLLSSTSPKGNVSSLHFTAAGFLDKFTNPLSQYISYAFDSVGNPTGEQVYTSGNTLRKQESYAWDTKHQMTSRRGMYGDTTSFAYASVGTVDSIWGPRGHHATFYHDQLKQADSVIQRNGTERIKTRFLNDGRGNLTKVTDPDNWQYLYKYDDRNRLTYDSNCITGVTKYGYDEADNLLWKKNAAGDSVRYQYDALNRLTKIAFPDSQNIYYRFDSVGYPYWRGHINQDSTPAVFTKYKYDLKGRLVQEIRKFASDTATYATSYQYDKDDNLDKLTYPSGRKVAYTYDGAGNVTQVKDSMTGGWAVLVDSISYAPFGGMEAWKLGNGMWFRAGYDSSYRLDSVSTNPDTLIRLGYVLDSVGNVTEVTNRRHSTETRSYAYDALDRLTFARGQDSPDTSHQYFYGYNGNLWKQIRKGSTTKTWTYEFNCNKVWHISTIAFYMTYDGLGSVIRTIEGEDNSLPPPFDGPEGMGSESMSGPSGPPAPDTITYQYNKSGTMKSINSGGTASYYYDAWLRRVKKGTGGGSWVKYIPSPSGQVLSEYSQYDTQRDHVYLNGLPIARLSSSAAERVLYVINDRTGMPMYYIDSAKNTKWRGRYYPYGEMYAGMVSTQNYHRYPGQWWDDESSLHYNWHRYFSPRIGRYYQADPIGLDGGINMYGYAGGNPIGAVDVDGLSVRSILSGLKNISDGLGLYINPLSAVNNYVLSLIPSQVTEGRYAFTGIGEEATDFWSKKFMETNNWLYTVPGGFAALWTPETWIGTATTLASARPVGAACGVPQSYWQYYPAGNTTYPSTWYAPSLTTRPPYPLGTAAREALNLPLQNPATAVRQANIPFWQPMRSPQVPIPQPNWGWPGVGKGLETQKGWLW